MLAAKAETPDGPGAGDLPSPTKRKSVLKKTFKAIGKVKPKFKSKKKTHQMELMQSCSSFNFEASDRSDDEDADEMEEEELEVELIEDEEEEAEQALEKEVADLTSPVVEKPRRKGTDDSNPEEDSKSSPKRASTPKSSRTATTTSDDEDGGDMASSAESTPTSKRRSQVKAPSMMNLAPQLDIPALPAPEAGVSSSKPSKHSRKKGGGKRQPSSSSAKSPVASRSSGHKSKKSDDPMPAPDLKSLASARSPKREAPSSPLGKIYSPAKSRSPKSPTHGDSQLSTRSPIQANPPPLPSSIPEEVEDDDDEDNDESLKRLSRAFGDESGMGSYFAKLQDLKHKDPTKPHSYSTSAEKSVNVSKPSSTHELGGTHLEGKERASRNFKASKNIKKLFSGMTRTSASNTKEGEKNAKSEKRNVRPQSKDEAAKLMLELSVLATKPGASKDDRPMKSHTTRPTRSFIFDDADENESTQEFPDIPTAKKTSLSDIRRMMDSSKGDTNTALARKQSRGWTTEHNRPSSSKTFHERTRRRSSMDHGIEENEKEEEQSRSPKKPVKTGESPTSVTDVPGSEAPAKSEEETTRAPTPPAPEERPLSPGSRKSRGRYVKRSTSESSDGSGKRPFSTPEAESPVSEELEEVLLVRQSSSHSSGRRRKGARNSTPVIEEGEGGEEGTGQPLEKDSVSPGSLRRKKVPHRRHGERRSATTSASQSNRSVSPSDERRHERRSATTGSSQSKRSVSPSEEYRSDRRRKSPDPADEDFPQAAENQATDNEEEPAKDSDHCSRRSRRMEPRVRASPDVRNQRKGTGSTEEKPKSEGPSSTQNLGRPPLDASTASSRRHSRRLDKGSSEPQIRRSRDPGEEPAERPPTIEEKAKNPSLAESLEKGNMLKMKANDGQYSVSTDGGSEMFVKGKMKYSKIRSDDSVGAPQLIIDSNDGHERDLRVKNV